MNRTLSSIQLKQVQHEERLSKSYWVVKVQESPPEPAREKIPFSPASPRVECRAQCPASSDVCDPALPLVASLRWPQKTSLWVFGSNPFYPWTTVPKSTVSLTSNISVLVCIIFLIIVTITSMGFLSPQKILSFSQLTVWEAWYKYI